MKRSKPRPFQLALTPAQAELVRRELGITDRERRECARHGMTEAAFKRAKRAVLSQPTYASKPRSFWKGTFSAH